ncbi:MAG: dihydropteroate synthase [Psychromonas sp.]|nr:dihydropteroate synthase [Psychromonas sp.]
MHLRSGTKQLDLNSPKIMGILNVTPDSFSDGGKFEQVDNALKQAIKMVEQGASIIDIGAESTRPGATAVSLDEELTRVMPIIEKISANINCWLSIDTSKAMVMKEAVLAGADIINDVRALRNKGALEIAVKENTPVCLMHMQDQTENMQVQAAPQNVLRNVKDFLLERIEACLEAGMQKSNIILDLGFGFGKSLEDNLTLLAHIKYFVALKYPILTGVSRKSMFGKLLNREINERLAGSLAGAMIAMQAGSQIIRVHDVQETVDVMRVLQAIKK